MVFRFWRRMKVAPGVTLNLSKSGGSLSFGPRGAKVTAGPRGTRATAGLPGTGFFYTQTLRRPGSGKKRGATAGTAGPGTGQPPPRGLRERLDLGFFARLTTPADEKSFVAGCRELVQGNREEALGHLSQAAHLADGAYLAGFLALDLLRLPEAAQHLGTALAHHAELGRYFRKYGMDAVMSLAVTGSVDVHVRPDLRGVLLGLVEVYQEQGRWPEAIDCLARLRRLEPDDMIIKLSLVEVLLEAHPDDRDVHQRIVRLAGGIENETALHAELLYYRARALRGLGLLEAARDTLTAALRRRKDRPAELLRAIRYERALLYEDLGLRSRARSELEKLFSEDPDFRDVASRLGL